MSAEPGITAVVRCHRHAGLAGRVARAVAPHVDRLVVAAGGELPAEQLGAIAAAEPRVELIRLPPLGPEERAEAWLLRHCEGGWLLRVAGGELPSLALLRSLRVLAADARHSHYRLPVDSRPPFEPRLLRADPALVHHPGGPGSQPVVAGGCRYLDLPLWRLAAEARAEPLPPDEAEHVRGVLAGPLDAPDGPPAHVPLAPAGEIDALWNSQRWSDADRGAARLEAVGPAPRLAPGRSGIVHVALTNESGRTWPWGDGSWPPVRITHRWGDGAEWRAPLPGPVRPGERVVVPVAVRAPAEGSAPLEVGLVREDTGPLGAALAVPLRQ